jgi:hypothetical protein
MVGIPMTQEEKRIAKNAAWRASKGLPPRPLGRYYPYTRFHLRSGLVSKRDKRNADHIDGYDRDDLGLSPDF